MAANTSADALIGGSGKPFGVESDDEGSEETKAGRRGRLRKWVAGGAVGLILLATAGWAIGNVFLNLSSTKQRIERKAFQLAGAPLEIGRILVLPWGEVRLTGLRLNRPGATDVREEISPLVSCGEIRVEVAPLSLLTGNIRVRKVEILDPALSVVRSRNGGVLLPLRAGDSDRVPVDRAADPGVPGAPALPREQSPMIVAPGTAADGTVSSEGLLAEVSAEEGLREEKGLMEEVRKEPGAAGDRGKAAERRRDEVVPTKEAGHPIVIQFRGRKFYLGEMILRRGSARLTSLEGGNTLMSVEDFEMEVNLGENILQPGRFAAHRVGVLDLMEMTDLKGEVVQNGLWMDFLNVEAKTEGGGLAGKIRASPFFGGVPFLAVIEGENVAVAGIASRIAPGIAIEGGALEGELKVLGRLRDPSSYRGLGEIRMAGARLGRSRILEPFSRIADMSALVDVAVDDFYAKIEVAGSNIAIEDLRASTGDIMLAGRGVVGSQGWLQVALRLYLSDRAYFGVQAIERHLPEGKGMGFVPYEGSIERYYRDYLITGTAEVPLINFWAPDENVPVVGLEEQFIQLLGMPRRETLPGSVE